MNRIGFGPSSLAKYQHCNAERIFIWRTEEKLHFPGIPKGILGFELVRQFSGSANVCKAMGHALENQRPLANFQSSMQFHPVRLLDTNLVEIRSHPVIINPREESS